MKPRLLLYILLALAGAVCLYSGLKFHRDVSDDGTAHKDALTVGLTGSPLYTRTSSVDQAVSTDTSATEVSTTTASESSWHPVSTSALLAVVGLILLLAAGRMRKAAA